MMEEMHFQRAQREAGEKLRQLMAFPDPSNEHEIGNAEFFDPWDFFPLYGSYSSDFDQLAIDVLDELIEGKKVRDDLAAEMFREILCNLELCDYGTSPRVCFPTSQFASMIVELRDRWMKFSALSWQ